MRRRASLILVLALLAACRREPAKPEAFKPPADGRLTEAQVRLHLQGSGLSPDEREWVRARVQEARLAGLTSGLDEKVIESRRRILRSLEERSRTAKDPKRKAELERDIAEVRRLLQGAPPEVAPSVRDNAELVARLEKEKK
ncbi:MAG: hypothetical protein ABUT39_06515 [Acidobacteriota bacterium]